MGCFLNIDLKSCKFCKLSILGFEYGRRDLESFIIKNTCLYQNCRFN